ncbi:ABC transporter substrate-binding protein [Bacillus marinisedimentorum]|uniref:ABC transporter substrate-binding protein n=1 Tax=Bacillus marinisedimentorum TaxID=1821260 RepID=UPI000872ECFA|nr:ABC transporter substrate-binding protein [Bacillus marinisedimentorum]
MKKLLLMILILAMLLAACSSAEEKDESQSKPDLLEADWEEITEEASGSEVHIFMWGGDDGINTYIDEWVAPRLKDEHNITLKRHPMDTADFLSKLMTEKKAGKDDGTMDIIWINGENFKTAKENSLLYGAFAPKLPNLQDYIGEDKPYVNNDMGTSIDGLEAPWGKVQFVLNYDAAKVSDPPADFTALKQWIEDNPGRFTYPNVSDFTGNAFVRHLLYDIQGKEDVLQNGYEEKWLKENGAEAWDRLNEMEGSLWRDGKTYPETLAKLDQLYANGEVDFTMGFNERRTASLIEDGVFPETTETLVIDPGSIGNTHYLSIPFNSPNEAAAMTAINFMLSPEAQIAKLAPAMWGEGSVIDPGKLMDEQLQRMEELGGETTVTAEDILPELDARYADWIKEHWENEVVQP